MEQLVMRTASPFVLTLASCFLIGTSGGCGRSVPVNASPAAPTSPLPTSIDVPRVPHVDCLIDEFGIAQKAIVIERGIRCQDHLPEGSPTGEPLRFFWPYYIHETRVEDGATYYKVGD